MPGHDAKILDSVRRHKCASRKTIQSETGLAWGTLHYDIDRLIKQGYLASRRQEPTGRGRPVLALCLQKTSAYLLGLDIGSRTTKMVFCDLSFAVIYEDKVMTPRYTGQESFTQWLIQLIEQAIAKSRVQSEQIVGIGVSVSGNVDSDQGVIASGANFGIRWGENIPISRIIEERIKIPSQIMTTQVAAVWAEYHFGEKAGCANLVTIGLGVGIGSGVVADHQLLVSRPGRAIGYIGHILVPGNQRLCVCGYKGCLESFSGGESLALVAAEKIPDKPKLHSAKALDEAAAAGDEQAMAILTKAASYNATGIASMIQFYSPDAVIFSGGQCRADGFLYRKTLDAIYDVLPRERREQIAFSRTILGVNQSALGAARLAYEKTI